MEMKLLRWASATVVLALLILGQSSTSASADLIEDTCNKTTHVELCVSFLRSKLGSATADVKGLAQMVAEQVQTNVRDAISKATISYKEATDQIVKKCIVDCVKLYGLNDADAALQYLQSDNFSNAREALSKVHSEADTCEESFHEFTGISSPLTKENNDIKNFGDIGAEIVFILG